MTEAQQFLFATSMAAYGGGFAKAMAEAYFRADPMNRGTIEQAFPGLVDVYGPGSAFYKATEAAS